MFCTNCGREIIDTAKFCNFCGLPVKNLAASVPVQPVQPVQPIQPVQPVQPVQSQPAPDLTESADVSAEDIIDSEITEAEESVSEQAEAPVEEAVEGLGETDAALPTPNNIPSYGESTPVYPAPTYGGSAPVNAVPVQISAPESKPEKRPERKYTLGHIMLCLAAVAVMAIVAGVFAGLYFSVV